MAYKDEGKETKFAVKGYKIEVSIFEEKRIGSHIRVCWRTVVIHIF